jgi:UDP-glucuronate decarboxylase
MRRILVTGGAGFLGSHLCERLLLMGDEVLCLDSLFTGSRQNVAHLLGHSHFELLRHDVTQPLTVEVDQIYHLACPASPIHYQRNPVRTIRTAVEGTLNMLDMAREVHARILITSTSEVYGDPRVHPQTEAYWGNVNPIGPRACYDEGKRCAEALTVSYARQFGVETRIARVFNTFGPRMLPNDGRVVSNFIMQAMAGEPLSIHGDGAQTRSFCYVSDLIEAVIRLMTLEEDPGPVNLGAPHEITIAELARLIVTLVGSGSKIVHQPLPTDDPRRRKPDISKARQLLDWEPGVRMEDGLRQTIDYFRSQRRGTQSSGPDHGTRIGPRPRRGS